MTTARIREFIGTPLSSTPTKVLLLGSGELGKELAIEAHKLGLEVVAVDRYDNAPAMHLAHRKYVIDMLDGKAVKEVVYRERPEAIIPEVEAVNTETLKELEFEGYFVTPNADAVRICMNRIELREFIAKKLELPTTKYFIVDDEDSLINACYLIGYPCIVKPEMSSSGHGHVVLREPLPEKELRNVYRYAIASGRGLSRRVIVEEFVDLVTEFTVLTYRYLTPNNDIAVSSLEPVEHWRYGYFHYIESWQPSDRDNELLGKCRDYAVRIVETLGGYGIYGVELFLVRDGRLLVSEVAPRPHDTGFVTLVTQDLSEFAIHLRAALRLPIPRVNILSAGASYAIYTDSDGIWGPKYRGICEVLSVDGVELRLFGKPFTYRGRRMAVLLARGRDVYESRVKLRKVLDKLVIS